MKHARKGKDRWKEKFYAGTLNVRHRGNQHAGTTRSKAIKKTMKFGKGNAHGNEGEKKLQAKSSNRLKKAVKGGDPQECRKNRNLQSLNTGETKNKHIRPENKKKQSSRKAGPSEGRD